MSETLAELIRRRADELGESYASIARRAGLAPQRISQLIAGKPVLRPTERLLLGLAKGLDVPYREVAAAARIKVDRLPVSFEVPPEFARLSKRDRDLLIAMGRSLLEKYREDVG